LFAIGLATSWWPYTKLDFTEPLITTTFFLSFLLLKNGRTLGGFSCAGFLLLLRTDSVVLVAVLFVWHLRRSRASSALWLSIAGTLPSLICCVTLNLLRFGTVLDRGYANESFTTPLMVGIYGILFSAGKSVFLFSPPLIAGVAGWRALRRSLPDDALLFAAVFLAQLVFYAQWWDWSGDDSWGVRFLLLSVVLMTIPIIEVTNRRLIFATLLLGFIIQVPAVLVTGLEYVVKVHTATLQRARIGIAGQNTIDLEDIRFNPRYSQVTGQYAIVLNRIVVNAPPTSIQQSPTTLSHGQFSGTKGRCRWDFWWCR
jgi:hypothetical protein